MPRKFQNALSGPVSGLAKLASSVCSALLGRPATDAPDLSQEALLRALNSGEVARHPRAFIARIARNIAIDEARKLKVRGGAALQIDALPDHVAPWVGPDQEAALLLKQVIMGLPELYRDVFILSRFHGLSYEEIARERGLSVKAIEYRMSRALALCQEALRD